MSSRESSTIGRSGFAALVALAFALLALPAAAGAASTGISGHLTFAGWGNVAVAGAEICAEGEGGGDFACTQSDVNGNYQVLGLAPGNYVVSFEATESSPYVVFQRFPGDVTVNADTITIGVDAAVTRGGSIVGTVVDGTTGDPLSEVEVCSIWVEGNEYDACDITSGIGSFKLIGLHPGAHEIEFWAWDGGYETRFVNIPVASGFTVNASAALLQSEGEISGHVYAAATHAPLAGVAVCAIWVESGRTGGCATTDGAGAYGFFPVPSGALKIVFSPEPAEVEFDADAKSDAWPTQFWDGKPTLAEASVIEMTRTGRFDGIDALLGPGPATSSTSGGSNASPPASPATPPVPVAAKPTTAPTPKPLRCRKGKVKKRVKGKTRCVKRHKLRHHKRHAHKKSHHRG